MNKREQKEGENQKKSENGYLRVCVCLLQNMTLKTSASHGRIIITSFKNKLINKVGLLKLPARNI